MRHRIAACAILALATVACTPAASPAPSAPAASGGPGSTPGTVAPPAPSPSPSPSSACRAAVARLTTTQLAHQVLVVGVDPSLPEPDATTRALLAAGIGGVIYIPTTTAPATQVRALSDALHAGATITPLITVDQEGGQVARLVGPGFDAVPSAAQQATLTPDALREHARTWGAQLAAAGIDVDLAPVADVVDPALVTTNEPVSLLGRGYGTDPATVSRHVAAFNDGLRSGGTGPTLKHYPGLGASTTNTDFGPATDTTTTLQSPSLQAFRDNAGTADLVMVSSVTYTRIDARHRAAFSPTVMQAVRNDLRFAGPIISDDLGAAAAVADLPAAERATAFAAAGGDLVLTVEPAVVDEMAAALAAKADADPAFRARLADAVERILTLKDRRKLHAC